MKTDMPSALTGRQRQVLEFIRETIAENSRPPTAREICGHFGLASPRSATQYLRVLERKGYLQRLPGQSRNIRVLGPAAGIPVVGEVAAGRPILAVENVIGSLDLARAFGRGELFAVRVKGDSMVKCGILDGDHVIVRRQPDVLNGAIAVAYLEGEATVKRVYKTRHGYRLQPENDSYDPIEVPAPDHTDESAPGPDFRLAGPVVGVVRTVRQ
jgi:repressor LexA